ncbi:MAG: YihY/virulence factor BrkB family protein [Chloroflexi bacterium]|nr:YihY/virulence factor BrkB family protein [Chloroflexota bacterium]
MQELKSLLASPPGRMFQKFMDDRGLMLASLLAWGMLNTFLPLLLGILSLIGLLLGDSAAAREAENRLLAVLPPAIDSLVRDSLTALTQAATGAGLISLGLLLFGGSNFFVTLETVFDLVYHVPERNVVIQRVVSFAGLFGVTALLLITTGAAILGSGLGETLSAYIPALAGAVDAGVGTGISVSALVVMMVLMYWLIPNRRHSLLHALPGAALASVALLLVVRIFPIYIALFGGGFSVYAAFGSILVFMFWLYIVGVVLVAGAVLNAFVEDPQRSVELAAIAARARTGQLEFPEART